jgi:hypothetical protein
MAIDPKETLREGRLTIATACRKEINPFLKKDIVRKLLVLFIIFGVSAISAPNLQGPGEACGDIQKSRPPKDIHVDNIQGSDKYDGLSPKPTGSNHGPVATMAKAVSLLNTSGQTVHKRYRAGDWRLLLDSLKVSALCFLRLGSSGAGRRDPGRGLLPTTSTPST